MEDWGSHGGERTAGRGGIRGSGHPEALLGQVALQQRAQPGIVIHHQQMGVVGGKLGRHVLRVPPVGRPGSSLPPAPDSIR